MRADIMFGVLSSRLPRRLLAAAAAPARGMAGSARFVDGGELTALCSGGKTIANETEHTFTCTNCGSCCRDLSGSIMLDTADVHRLQASTQAQTSVQDATTLKLGEFTTDSLIPPSYLAHFYEYCAHSELCGCSRSGVLPVLYMSPRMFSSGPQCKFAMKKPGSISGLLCSVGPTLMPTACVLYPYGEFVPAADLERLKLSTEWLGLPTSLQEQLTSAQPTYDMMYTLDLRGCEGVTPAGMAALAPTGSGRIEVYERSNDLKSRRQAYMQWLFLMQAVANMNIIESLQRLDAVSMGLGAPPSREQRRAKRRARTGAASFATAAFVRSMGAMLYDLPGDGARQLPWSSTSRPWACHWPAVEEGVQRLARGVHRQLPDTAALSQAQARSVTRIIIELCRRPAA